MVEKKGNDIIDIGLIIKKIWSRRKLFLYRVWPVTFVLSCLYIVCIPRYYMSDSRLVPELGNSFAGGGLSSIASSFGISLDNSENGDAISPMLYPDLLEDNGFMTSLFTIRVKSADGEIDTDYYTYLKKYQKSAWWSAVIRTVTDGIKSIFPQKDTKTSSGDGEKSPYWLSEDEHGRLEMARSNISFSVDKQTAVISVTAKAQDPLIAKTLVDSVQLRLQQFITDYRTKKARVDEAHYRELVEEARRAYDDASTAYAAFSDSHSNSVLQEYQVKATNLERDMEMKFAVLQQLSTQLSMASAKVQERTPAFTVIKGAEVAIKPAGPKRMIFVLGMLIFVTFVGMFWVVRKELHF